MRVRRSGKAGLFMALVIGISVLVAPVAGAQQSDEQRPGIDFVRLFDMIDRLEPLYAERIEEWIDQGYSPVEEVEIVIPGGAYTDYSGDTPIQVVNEFEGETGSILLWEEEETSVTWEVEVEQAGLYWLAMEYYPLSGRRASLLRDLRVNGEYQFNEARRLQFERVWRDLHPPRRDNQGNDIRPPQVETPEWLYRYVQDPEAMYREPFYILLEEGVNTLTFRSIREPVAIKKLVVTSPVRPPTYDEVLAEYRSKGYREVQDVVIKIDAESPVKKSDPTVRAEYGYDPLMDPPSDGYHILNEFGSWRWRMGNQWAEWRFTVPESGLYKIGIKRWQGWNRMPSVREIRINGEVPFRELEEFTFPYNYYWNMDDLGPEDGEPFLFYFEEGEHTLSMRVKVGRGAETIRMLDRTTRELAGIGRAITYLTGPDPDPFMEYEVHRQIPDLLPTMAIIRDRLLAEAEELQAYAGTRVDLAEVFRLTADQLDSMIRNPYRIHIRLDEFAEMQSRLGHFVLELRYLPLAVDYMLVAAPDTEWPQVKANWFQRVHYQTLGFLESFQKDYSGVGNIYEDEEALTLWVAWGREWAMVIKEMIEEDFTPHTGVRVNVNVVPRSAVDAQAASVILLAAAAGKAPDLAMGVDQQLPVEFAIRGGVLDIAQFEDFPEVTNRFRDGMLTPYTFRGGTFALPETQSFNMMFYRTDIFDEMGLEPPETWQEVLNILPTLQQRGLNFYFPSPAEAAMVRQGGALSFAPFLYQHGADFYTEDGFRSALTTPEALQAFRMWTDLFANYKIPLEANFYNRMRTGEIPIGVADYYNYVLLSTAAPELTGWWKMVPIPGIRQPDGSVNRSAGGLSTATVAFSDTTRPDDAWELMKWWTSTDVQTRYAEELEALIGVEAKWNTANIEAFNNLPWPSEDIAAVQEQWRWFQEKPVVLGDYFTPRHLLNAWNRVVLQGRNPRESLELAIEDINRELIRKQEEFGIEIPEDVRRDLFRGRYRVR